MFLVTFVYDLLLFLLLIPATVMLLLRYRRRFRPEFAFLFSERLGKWKLSASEKTTPLLWVHCASVGEVRAVEPLLKELHGFRLLLTVLTPSGRHYAEKNKVADYIFLAPLDFTFITSAVIKKADPSALILVETEFWPGLILAAKKNSVPIFLINARLSKHSYNYYAATKPLLRRILVHIKRVGARSPEDAERFIQLGYPRERIYLTGNIKYDRPAIMPDVSRERLGVTNTDYLWVAGSTRSGEEEIILDAWLSTRTKYPNLKLAIAPRHLDRVPDILELMLHKKVTCSLYSSHPSSGNYDCLLIDTFGDLQKFYASCDIAFVGGSLVNKGGQNPIEPAAYAKPVIFGPFMDNFLTEANILESMGGGFRARSRESLHSLLDGLLSDKARRRLAGQKACEAVESQKGALLKTKELITTELRI